MTKMLEAYKNINIRENTNAALNLNNFVYFWNGIFSQWYTSSFTIDGIKFNCAEQYMMYKKAKLFNDDETSALILETQSPKEQKALGRKVKNFDLSIWDQHCGQIVYDANYAKFTQNKGLSDQLLSFHDQTFVEASPYDNVWGIGIDEFKAESTPYQEWNGENKLGLVLTILRNNLSRQ